MGATGVGVIPEDLARVVDTERKGASGGHGIVECGERATAEEEAVRVVTGVIVLPDDLTCVVDALCKGLSSRGKIEVGEGARAVEKAVRIAIGVFELPDDLARVVDAGGDGGARRFGEVVKVPPL